MTELEKTEMKLTPLAVKNILLHLQVGHQWLKSFFSVVLLGVSVFIVNAHAGEFDDLGYSAFGLLKAVAAELKLENDIQLQRTKKTDYCKGRVSCSAIRVTGSFEQPGLLDRIISPLAKPCAYSQEKRVSIKNPSIAAAKTKPIIDGIELFCRSKNSESMIVLIIFDSSGALGAEPLTVVIKSNEYGPFNWEVK